MAKLNLDRGQLDHPEHFDDEIREFRDSGRYVPTALESLLFELAGHRCTICGAPWMEIHHIDEISEGGKTSFENLIVLCPNCHTRVHREKVPSKAELRHYKLKQEIAYELSVLSRLTVAERDLIAQVAALPDEDQIAFTKRYWREIEAASHEEAVINIDVKLVCFTFKRVECLVLNRTFAAPSRMVKRYLSTCYTLIIDI